MQHLMPQILTFSDWPHERRRPQLVFEFEDMGQGRFKIKISRFCEY